MFDADDVTLYTTGTGIHKNRPKFLGPQRIDDDDNNNQNPSLDFTLLFTRDELHFNLFALVKP